MKTLHPPLPVPPSWRRKRLAPGPVRAGAGTLLVLLAGWAAAAPVPAGAVSAGTAPAGQRQEADGAAVGAWREGRKVDGVRVYYRSTTSPFREHRAQALVCTDLPTLERFVSDAQQFTDWVPFTRSARRIEWDADTVVYYVRSTTPWPMADRDMVYRIRRVAQGEEGVRLVLEGLPDFLPEVEGVARIRSARGEWVLSNRDHGVRVSYRLYLDPGKVPAFAANRRLATVVGQTLANLAARFPCPATTSPPG